MLNLCGFSSTETVFGVGIREQIVHGLITAAHWLGSVRLGDSCDPPDTVLTASPAGLDLLEAIKLVGAMHVTTDGVSLARRLSGES